MTIQDRHRSCGLKRFGAGTYWRRGPIRLDISIGVFSSESTALDYAACCRSVRAAGRYLLLQMDDGTDFKLDDNDCLAYDTEILKVDHSWSDAALPWHETLAAVASGQPFACIARVVLWVASDLGPTAEEMRAGATDLVPPQCGHSANWFRDTTSM